MSTEPKTCPCGRPTLTPYHAHCATCIRHATPCPASTGGNGSPLGAIRPTGRYMSVPHEEGWQCGRRFAK